MVRITRRRFIGGAAGLAALLSLQSCGLPGGDSSPKPVPSSAGCCQDSEILGAVREPSTAVPSPTAEPSPTATAIPSPTVITGVENPAQGAGDGASGAQPAPPPSGSAPAPPPAPAGATGIEAFVNQVASSYGIVLVLEGQDWGPDEANQLSNLQAAVDAFSRLPGGVRAAVARHNHGLLHILSNRHGRTLLGWQPFGDFPMGFYTNSDRAPGAGAVPSNQIIGIPGFSSLALGHELMHAYHFRDTPPDRYGLVMLQAEMRSFAAATGWTQVGSDQQIIDASVAGGSWQTFNALFAYNGRTLTYINAGGSATTLTPTNPMEAFAITGSFYYTRPSWQSLPDWPEYWNWFQSNLG